MLTHSLDIIRLKDNFKHFLYKVGNMLNVMTSQNKAFKPKCAVNKQKKVICFYF